MLVLQGHLYTGGADVPFFVSNSKIRSGLEDKGFTDIQILTRNDVPIASYAFLVPPGTDDSWNTLISGRRAAPDGVLDVPSAAKWVVDITPQQQPQITVAATTGGAMPDTPLPSFLPTPSAEPTGPAVVPVPPSSMRLPIFVGLGVIGGVFIGKWAAQHLFVEGLTPTERKNILFLSGAVLGLWGAVKVFGLENAWWLTPEGMAERAQTELSNQ